MAPDGEILEAGPRDGMKVPGNQTAIIMPAGTHVVFRIGSADAPTFQTTLSTVRYERHRGLDGRVIYVHPDLLRR